MKILLSTVHCQLSAERHRLVLWVPVFLAIGIGMYFALPNEPALGLPMRFLAGLMGLLLLTRRHFAARLACMALILVNIGFIAAYARSHSIQNPVYSGAPVMRSVSGVIDDIQLKEEGEKLILRSVYAEDLLPEETPQRISISLRKVYPDLQVGNEVSMLAMLFPPPGPAMPGAYDFARAFYFQRIGAVGFSPSVPQVVSQGAITGFGEWLTDLRLSIGNRIMDQMSAQNGPVAAALMVGEQSAVSREVGDAMRDAGLYHVLSISGLHLSLAAGLIYFTVRLLLALWPVLAMRVPAKKIAAAAGLLGAFAYLMLAGYPVPAIRSFVMVACVMVAVLLDRRGISLYSLAWAAVIILLWQPESLLGASFELSFAATAAILAFYERFSHLVFDSSAGVVRKAWLYFAGLMFTSLVATLATTPLVVYHFNRFTLWGIAANMLMIPLASFWIMPMAVLAFLLMPLGMEAWPLAGLDWGIGLMIEGSKWVASFPYAAFALPSPSFGGMLLCVFGGLWLCIWQRRWRLLGVLPVVAGLATMGFFKPYDLLVSSDAKRVALRLDNGQFLFLRGRTDSFDAELWLRAHGQEEGLTLKNVPAEFAPQCDKEKCVALKNNYRIAVAKSKNNNESLCETDADIVVAQSSLEDAPCKDVPFVIDRTFLQANGAVGIRLGNPVGIDLAQEHRGNRPWTPR